MNDQNGMRATLLEVARLYYEDHLSQQQIADRLGVSRSLIALYLKKAQDQGIVRIEIVDLHDRYEELSYAILSQSTLKQVTVVPGSHNAPELTRRALGGAVARYLVEQLKHGDVVGIGWGRTMMEIAGLLAPSRPLNIEVLPLVGESAYTGNYSQNNQIILKVAQSFEGEPHFLMAPAVVGSKKLRDMLLEDESARPVTECWDRITYALVGIGSLPATAGQTLFIGEEAATTYLEKGAVGDISVHYLNIEGEIIYTEVNGRLIGISVDQLKKTPNVIAAAGGVEKTQAVIGALRTGLITHLYLDEELARSVLEEMSPDQGEK